MAFTIYMVRHGQTFLNKYNRLQGWCDSPLTLRNGRCSGAGRHLAHINFDHAYHSDTTRAMRTCRYILEENIASNDITPKRNSAISVNKALVILKATLHKFGQC